MKLGLGTAALGRPQYINIRTKNIQKTDLDAFRKHSFSVLEEAYALGMRYFDTAPGYGLAEALVLEWLQTKNDPTIEIATKWGYTYTANFDKNAIIHEVKEHSLAKLNAQWDFSKQLLPYLKVYQIHSATIETGVLENFKVLERLASLKKEHNLKIGLTTTGANQAEVIKKALNITVDGASLFDLFQVTYNFLDQSILKVSEELIQENKSIVIKEALANGRVFRNESYPHYNKMYEVLESISKKHNVGVDAISLKYCEQTIPNSIILSGASTIRQLQENLKADTFMLSSQDLALLDAFKTPAHYYWSERKKLTWN
jgi:aryl-alcohol dehydrogenase-like predicted oxidoreductase